MKLSTLIYLVSLTVAVGKAIWEQISAVCPFPLPLPKHLQSLTQECWMEEASLSLPRDAYCESAAHRFD